MRKPDWLIVVGFFTCLIIAWYTCDDLKCQRKDCLVIKLETL